MSGSAPSRPRKSLGQHFLHDTNIVRKILDAAEIAPGETVVEVGPGRGALTCGLADRAGRVVALEIDRQLAERLRERLADRSHVTVVTADAVDYEFGGVAPRFKVVANLPYNAATPIIFRLLDFGTQVISLVVMVQREVAERMIAPPGGRDYGALSIGIGYQTEAKILFRVAPGCFTPRPKVESAVVRLVPRSQPPFSIRDETFFIRVVRDLFSHRRKTIRNALRDAGHTVESVTSALKTTGIDPGLRPQQLSAAEIGRLADGLFELHRGM